MKTQYSYFAFGMLMMMCVTSVILYSTGGSTDTTDARLKELGTQLDNLDQQVDKLLAVYHARDQEVLNVLTENHARLAATVEALPADAESVQVLKQVMESQQRLIEKVRKRVEQKESETTGA